MLAFTAALVHAYVLNMINVNTVCHTACAQRRVGAHYSVSVTDKNIITDKMLQCSNAYAYSTTPT